MSDIVDRLKQAYEAAKQSPPDERRRQAAFDDAMRAFDEESVSAAEDSRHRRGVVGAISLMVAARWKRLIAKCQVIAKPVLAGGLAVVFLGLAVHGIQFVHRISSPQQYVQSARDKPASRYIKVQSIVVASRPLRFGMQLKPENLKEVPWPGASIPDGGYAKVEDLLGVDGERFVLSAIEPNEPIYKWKVTAPGERASLAAVIDQGKRAVAIQVNDVLGVTGFVQPGDRVDVMLTRRNRLVGVVTDLLLQNVKILAIGQTANDRTNRPTPARTVTLEVGTVDAQKLALSRSVGKLSLALRSAGSAGAAAPRRITMNDLNPARELYSEGETTTVSRSQGDAKYKSVEEQLRRMQGQVAKTNKRRFADASDGSYTQGFFASAGSGQASRAAPNVQAQVQRGIKPQAYKVPRHDPREHMPRRDFHAQGRDRFEEISPNPVKIVREEPVSTFSIDVDTASYGFMRSSINRNVLPQADAVRVEELINYFPYSYAPPEDVAEPFRTHLTVVPTPWNRHTKLLHIGIKGYELPETERPRANLVFLIDTSGSMRSENKLPLLLNSLKLLVTALDRDDTVAIVTYAGRAGTALGPTKVRDKARILNVLDRLRAGGSTAGAAGIRQAYELAERSLDGNGVNRVILATDGDFNVGITDKSELKSYIERKRGTGISLSILGFGMGNYNDELMQTLAQNGNGNAAYIDTLSEARKVLVEEAGSTLFTIAKDVKIQIEFNPKTVSSYRLIGYESRLLKREDFNNDSIDAGEIGAGHSVTAIYEITPARSGRPFVDALRYQASEPVEVTVRGDRGEYAFLKIRYKLPDRDVSTKIETPVTRSLELESISSAPQDVRFAAAVAAFGQILRGGRDTGDYGYDDVIELALNARGDDEYGYRAEFIRLVRLAQTMTALPLQSNR